MKRAIFLDRDGVIIRTNVRNGKPYAITSAGEFEVLEGVKKAIGRLKEAGFLVIVVSNQPDVAAGKVTREFVEEVNRALMERLPIDQIMVCYEVDSACYKPRPGMLIDAAEEHGIDLGRSYMVGDRWRDTGAGRAAGCYTVFIDYGYDELLADKPDAVARSLPEAVELVLSLNEFSESGT